MAINTKDKKPLGKGLGSFGLTGTFKDGQKGVYEVDITRIMPNPNQPRKRFPEDELQSLADSIRQYGLVTPIAVRKGEDGSYEIVAGERRWRACQLAGLSKIPVVVKEYTTEEVSEIALVENLQRQDLDPMEEAFAYKYLMDTFKKTQDEIGQIIGRSRSYVANLIRLTHLSEAVQYELTIGTLTIGQARPLLALKDESQQIDVLQRILKDELSARQVEELVKKVLSQKKKTKKAKPTETAELRQLIQKMKASLGTKVDIHLKNAKEVQGTIEITFKNEEELLRIIERMED